MQVAVQDIGCYWESQAQHESEMSFYCRKKQTGPEMFYWQ